MAHERYNEWGNGMETGYGNDAQSHAAIYDGGTPGERVRGKAGTIIVVCGIVAALLTAAAFGVFMWNHWWRFDDAADIQGQWRVVSAAGVDGSTASGDAATIEITANELDFSTDAQYAYVINTGDKTLALSFLKLQGYLTYRFSPDRNTLALVDEQSSGFATFFADFGYAVSCVWAQLLGQSAPVPGEGENVTLLMRVENGSE